MAQFADMFKRTLTSPRFCLLAQCQRTKLQIPSSKEIPKLQYPKTASPCLFEDSFVAAALRAAHTSHRDVATGRFGAESYKSQTNSKSSNPKQLSPGNGFWDLLICVYLELGIWSLVLSQLELSPPFIGVSSPGVPAVSGSTKPSLLGCVAPVPESDPGKAGFPPLNTACHVPLRSASR